ncbi:DUF6984 family protein [Dyadobacter sandarakinus]|uniref:DUF6984 domain-containing protein n=1 Tax=Dyadobacter sandarakinus TaxID=2747268 RepID=A0ABX7ID90_9BACT|nr:hypothetical protein [Dyadobacter sandarakinus]QRR03417.1 hypothetical protein HWI92_22135 [Dyadobacter sandarakinus]
MKNLRPIRENEKELIYFLLEQLNFDPIDYPFNTMVDEYEGGKMGSISLGGDPNSYAGDLIQVEYEDSDGTPVVITLTKDTRDQLLDLDFWKTDFSKLLLYPSPDQVTVMKVGD